jgi:hypothetical protein
LSYRVMLDLKMIETSVLLVMLAAHSSNDGKELTVCEAIDRGITIKRLQDEIISRKNE